MKEKLKKLHHVMYGEEDGRESPFGYSAGFPDQQTLQEFFDSVQKEFAEHNKFAFECEEAWHGCGAVSYQWWLIGEKKSMIENLVNEQQNSLQEFEEVFHDNLNDILA